MNRDEFPRRFVIGVDGGGTKTACMLVDDTARVWACCVGAGSNHQIDGFSAALENVFHTIDMACAQAGVRREQLSYVYLGMAGADVPKDFEMLEGGMGKRLGGIPFQVVNDSWIAFHSEVGERWGAVSICGTGHNVAVKTPGGEVVSVRALRYMLGNYGGGTHLAAMALHKAFRAEEGTGDPTRLMEELPPLCGCESMEALATRIYQSGYRYQRQFNIPRLVFDLAHQGDAVCGELIRTMGRELGIMLGKLIQRTGLEEEAIPVVLSGSQYAKDEHGLLIEPVTQTLLERVPNARVHVAQSPPVVGAVMGALQALGVEVTPRRQRSMKEKAERYFA
ncbi:MAG: BadF/BadG/BcrA/BcrD ATPase family protein [Candidatus Limiplasma sp.]|nr:BadF/BadG/BcrA/BcrD ATPase family protein [Candidatus Limiplasma sp.]